MHLPLDSVSTLHHLLSKSISVSNALDPNSGNISLWLFGYGSLIWNPGFEYELSEKAILPGYERVFWHGNKQHRGTLDMPGRVVTIEQNPATEVHGLAFKATGLMQISAALKHLHNREIENGYNFELIEVTLHSGQKVFALTAVANHKSDDYIGPNSLDLIAEQIAFAEGWAGPNFEYLYKLAEYTRKLFPEINDDHLFQLEDAVKSLRKSIAAAISAF